MLTGERLLPKEKQFSQSIFKTPEGVKKLAKKERSGPCGLHITRSANAESSFLAGTLPCFSPSHGVFLAVLGTRVP